MSQFTKHINIADLVKDQLPRLRRFGLVVTQSQDVADRLLTRVLEVLLEDSRTVVLVRENPSQLFSMVLDSLSELGGDEERPRPAAAPEPLENLLLQLSIQERAVLALRFIEEFDLATTAAILRLGEKDVSAMERVVQRKLSPVVAH